MEEKTLPALPKEQAAPTLPKEQAAPALPKELLDDMIFEPRQLRAPKKRRNYENLDATQDIVDMDPNFGEEDCGLDIVQMYRKGGKKKRALNGSVSDVPLRPTGGIIFLLPPLCFFTYCIYNRSQTRRSAHFIHASDGPSDTRDVLFLLLSVVCFGRIRGGLGKGHADHGRVQRRHDRSLRSAVYEGWKPKRGHKDAPRRRRQGRQAQRTGPTRAGNGVEQQGYFFEASFFLTTKKAASVIDNPTAVPSPVQAAPTCSICCEDMTTDAKRTEAVLVPCGHTGWCIACITRHVKTSRNATCPRCRGSISTVVTLRR